MSSDIVVMDDSYHWLFYRFITKLFAIYNLTNENLIIDQYFVGTTEFLIVLEYCFKWLILKELKVQNFYGQTCLQGFLFVIFMSLMLILVKDQIKVQ